MTEHDALLETIFMLKGLAWLAVVLFLVMIINQGMVLGRMIRRFLGIRSDVNGGDPNDDLSVGQFSKAMKTARAQANARTMWGVNELKSKIDQRMNASDKQQQMLRHKFNVALILLRDMRAFTIYHKMPQDEAVPIETEDDDLGAAEQASSVMPEAIDDATEAIP